MDNASHAALHAALSGFRWSPVLPYLPATSSFLRGRERRRGAEIKIRPSFAAVFMKGKRLSKNERLQAVVHVCEQIPLRKNG